MFVDARFNLDFEIN